MKRSGGASKDNERVEHARSRPCHGSGQISQKGLAALHQRLQISQKNASKFIFRKIGINGRLEGGCEGRPLETTLAIHLFRDFPSIRSDELNRHCETLLAYCHKFSQKNRLALTGTLADIDTILSHMLVSKTIDDQDQPPESMVFRHIPKSFNAFTHPSNIRKRMLFSILLAEMGIIPFQGLAFDPHHFSSKSYHLIASMVMAAAQILYAFGVDSQFTVNNDDVRFLLENQSSNGGWENHVLLTLVALMALAKIGAYPEAVSRGIKFVVRQIRPDGSVPFIADEDTWITCMAGFVLTKVDPHHPALPRVAQYIASQQQASGGWCYSAGSKTDDTDDLSICLAFLKQFDAARYAAHIKKGEAHLCSLQNEDGGFPAFVQGAASEVELTAKAIMALACNSRDFDKEISRAIHWLDRTLEANGSFRREWKLSSSYPVAQVMYALKSIRPIKPLAEAIQRIRQKSTDYILNIQNPDGGWSPLPNVAQSSALSTAYALIALCSSETAEVSDAIIRGSEYILEHQADTGEFTSAPDSLGPRPIIYDVKPLNTIYPLWAIHNVIEYVLPAVAT